MTAFALFVVAVAIGIAWAASSIPTFAVTDSAPWIVHNGDEVNQLFNLRIVNVPPDGDTPQLRVYRLAEASEPAAGGGGGGGFSAESRALSPVLLFIHGGGWVAGSLDSYDAAIRALTGRLDGFVVVSVGYRLATEAPFPAPLLDCVAALRWTAVHAADYGGDARRIAVGGSSAGGNLAAAVVLMLLLQAQAPNAPALPLLWPPPPPAPATAASSSVPKLCAQWLGYPALDARMASETYMEFADGPGTLTAAKMSFFWDGYLASGLDAWNVLASPALAASAFQILQNSSTASTAAKAATGAWTAAAGSGFPATLVQTAGLDVLRREGEDYSAALSAAGARAQWVRYANETHGFMFGIKRAEGLDMNMPAWVDAVAFLRSECGLS